MFTTNAYHIKLEGDNYMVGLILGNMTQNIPGLANAHTLPAPSFSKQKEGKFIRMCNIDYFG